MKKFIAILRSRSLTLSENPRKENHNALGVIIMYITPIDQILAQTGGGGNSKNQGQGQDKVKDKDNNCENGLPPHKNGNDDNGNHLGCTGYKIVVKVK